MKVYELFWKYEDISIGVFENLFKAKEYAEQYKNNIHWKKLNDWIVADEPDFEIAERELNVVSKIDEEDLSKYFYITTETNDYDN